MKKFLSILALVLGMTSVAMPALAASTCSSCCPTPVVLLCKTQAGTVIRCSQAQQNNSELTLSAKARELNELAQLEPYSVANVCCGPQLIYVCKIKGGVIGNCVQK